MDMGPTYLLDNPVFPSSLSAGRGIFEVKDEALIHFGSLLS